MKRIYRQKLLVPLHPLNNIEITKYFNYEPRYNGAFSRNSLPRIKDEAYVTNLDYKTNKRRYRVSLIFDKNLAIYFDFFAIEYIPKEVLNKIKDKSITVHFEYKIMNLLCVDLTASFS